METVSIAFEYDNVVNIEQALNKAHDNAFDYIIVPLVHPRFERQTSNGLQERSLPLTRSDMLLSSSSWNQNIVGKFSEWINFDSEVETQRHNARKVSHPTHPTSQFRSSSKKWLGQLTLESLLPCCLRFTGTVPTTPRL